MNVFSGHRIDPLHIKEDDIYLEDIAHALSQICRYGGHSKDFYSVAQHSIAVSYLVKPENALCGLLNQ